jgi:hypothetical protein
MIPQTGTILCVEDKRPSRCSTLTTAGYTAVSAGPREALKILGDRAFDIVVTVGVKSQELNRIREMAHRSLVFPVDERIPPTVFLFMVDERLRQLRTTHNERLN